MTKYFSKYCFLFWLLGYLRITNAGAVVKEYCTSQTFHAKCSSSELVVMEVALYGRMRIGECVKTDIIGSLGCSSDVLHIADRNCSGKRECEIRVPNSDMDKGMKCSQELSRYLEASYRCVKAVHSIDTCTSATNLPVSSTPIHLPSTISVNTNCGRKPTPWILEASPGQKVNVSILDFGWNSLDHLPMGSSSTGNQGHGRRNCPIKYGYAIDMEMDEERAICGGGDGYHARERHLFTSIGHKIQVVINEEHLIDKRFLIQYNAVGCPNLVTPAHAWAKRDGDVLVVGCEATRQTWHLTCQQNRWVGVIGNCTQYLVKTPKAAGVTGQYNIFHNSIAILIIIGVATLISCTIILIGVFCYKKLSRHNKDLETEYQCSTFNTKSKDLYHVGDGMQEYHKGTYPDQIYPFHKNEYTHIWDQQQGSNVIDGGIDDLMQISSYPLHDAPLLPKPRLSGIQNNNNNSCATMDMSLDLISCEVNVLDYDDGGVPSRHASREDMIYRSSVSEPTARPTPMSQYYGLDK